MQKTYEPQNIEAHGSAFWEKQHLAAPSGQGTPYCIMLPPPNVTGSLHMGHGFQQTLMDALIRYHRMLGCNTLWQAGTDHAGIATQMVVERQLEAKGSSRHTLGREAFVEKVWEWKEHSGSTITGQIRRLGASIDWTRERFTLDEQLTHATQTAFIRLYEEGLIYRGKRLVNWDPKLKTAVSDLEVTTEEEAGTLYFIRYPLQSGTGHLTVATTRPETLLGDVAVAVHPEDPRYQSLIGQSLSLPLCQRIIPIIADEAVLPEFGSGCVKITPAHDFNDYEMGKRHKLEMINIMTLDAHLNETVPEAYRGLERYAARQKIIRDLQALGLVEKTEDYTLKIPRSSRSEAVIEPLLTEQWFVKAQALAEPALAAVKEGRIRFVPDNWANTYYQWLENIQDWCISRQLWWGHRIPAWFDEQKNIYVGYSEVDVRERHHLDASVKLEQENDVLDTWFSSALWPCATLGWPESTPDLSTFYPSSVLVTGFDIIFFWVARMVMFGLQFMNDVPFKEVYITGLIRDAQGHKMSKSKGNVLDPLDVIDGISLDDLLAKRCAHLMQPKMREAIEKATRKEFPEGIKAYGTDALRFTFCALASTGRNINFDLARTEGYRNFCTKLWNAARFVLMNTQDQDIQNQGELEYSLSDRWIKSILQTTIQNIHAHFKNYRFDLLAQALYEFIWNEYCDWYLEFSKTILNNPNSTPAQLAGTRRNLLEVLETILRLTHPVIPFITEAIWQSVAPLLGKTESSIMVSAYPEYNKTQLDSEAENSIQWAKEVIMATRNIRGERNIAPSKKSELYMLERLESDDEKMLNVCKSFIMKMAVLKEITILSSSDFEKIRNNSQEKATIYSYFVIKNLGGLCAALEIPVEISVELKRLQKEIDKLSKEQQKYSAKLSNETYINKAPAEIVQKDREHLESINSSLEKYQKEFDRLASGKKNR